uniref:Uncharacterized protein n=1 Tax=Cacopsylla melanoneura TaxID=428564 RepID=A0A8D8ZBR0_9HEMI
MRSLRSKNRLKLCADLFATYSYNTRSPNPSILLSFRDMFVKCFLYNSVNYPEVDKEPWRAKWAFSSIDNTSSLALMIEFARATSSSRHDRIVSVLFLTSSDKRSWLLHRNPSASASLPSMG